MCVLAHRGGMGWGVVQVYPFPLQISSTEGAVTVFLLGQQGEPAFIFGLICALLRSRVEKAMAAHSSTLAWKIPGTGEPGGVAQSQTQLK